MNYHHHRAHGNSPSASLFQMILPPIDLLDPFCNDTAALLVQEGNPVGESKYLYGLVLGKIAPIDQARLHLKGCSQEHRGVPGDCEDELGVDLLLQALLHQDVTDGGQAVRRR